MIAFIGGFAVGSLVTGLLLHEYIERKIEDRMLNAHKKYTQGK